MSNTENSHQNVFLLSSDLMVSSQVEGLAHRYEAKFKTCRNLEVFQNALSDIEQGIAILDLFNLPAPLDDIMQIVKSKDGISTLAFGPHVRTELLQQAEQAGCDLVIPRSQLERQLERLLSQSECE